MPKEIIFEDDLAKYLEKEFNKTKILKKCKRLFTGKAEFKIQADFDKETSKAFKELPILQAQLVEAAGEEFHESVSKLVAYIEKMEKALKKGHLVEATRTGFALESALKKEPKELEKNALKKCNDVLKKFTAKNKSADLFQKKLMAKSAINVVVSVTSITAVSIFLGFPVPIKEIVDFVFGCQALQNLILDWEEAWKDVHKQKEIVNKDLQKAMKDCNQISKDMANLKDGTQILVEVWFPAMKKFRRTFQQLFDSVDALETRRNVAEQKLQHAAKVIPELMKKERLAAKEAENLKSTNPVCSEAIKKAFAKFSPEAKLGDALNKASDGMQKLRKLDKEIEDFKVCVAIIRAKKPTSEEVLKNWKIFTGVAHLAYDIKDSLYDKDATNLGKAGKILVDSLATASEELKNKFPKFS